VHLARLPIKIADKENNMKNKTIVDDIFDRAAARNRAASMGEPVPVEAEPHVNPPLRGDEAVILRQASAIMAERGIHVTARKLWDMAMEIEKELQDDGGKQARD
jgi:hypothetical protein